MITRRRKKYHFFEYRRSERFKSLLKTLITIAVMLVFSLSVILTLPCSTIASDFSLLERTIFEEMKEKNTPGAAIAIVRGDRVLFAKGFGVTSVETNAQVKSETLFRLGSTTKMFTGAALAQLEEQGRLKLSAPISNYVKGLSPKLSQVSAHQLASNSAGLRDSVIPIQTDDDSGLRRMISNWTDDVFFTEPGRIYSYSSAGFWLAGLVIEETCGKPYADDMDELLFKPLGMNRTTFRPLVAMTYTLALGHNIQPDGKPAIIRPAFNNVAMWPAGSIFSSVDDLSRWVIALMNEGRIDGQQSIPASVVRKITDKHITIPGEADSYYGYGLMQFNYRGVRFWGHGGFSRGYGSMIQIALDQKYAVIILTNKSGETLPKTLGKAMELGLKLDPEPKQEPAKSLPMSKDEMHEYAGTYSHPPSERTIFIKGDQLFLKDDGKEYQLKKTATDKFQFGDAGESEIVLVRGRDGKVEHLFDGLYSARKIKSETVR